MRRRKSPPIRTVRPDDDKPADAYRYGAAVILTAWRLKSVLTPAEARELATTLTRAAATADATPRTSCHDKTRQLPAD